MATDSKRYGLDDLLYLMARLRNPQGGCPWDLEQDFQSITASTLEEAYELVDAIQHNDVEQIRDELGDVLFQVVFYSQMGKEKQWFDMADVIHAISAKLVRRHPHVFPTGELYETATPGIDSAAVMKQWDEIKQAERAGKQKTGLLADIPLALPALKRAAKIQKRVSKVGFDFADARAALAKIREEIDELEQALAEQDNSAAADEMGDLLFSCVNVARLLDVDAEMALAASNRKFTERFHYVEQGLAMQGKSPDTATFTEMDALWEQAKGNP